VSSQSQQARRPTAGRRGPALTALAAIVALAFGAAACGSSGNKSSGVQATATPDQFKILAVMPMSGPLAIVGQTQKAGFEAAVKNINAGGGVLGKKATLTVVDDAGTGAKAVAGALRELPKGYQMVSCGSFGDDGLACAPAIAKQNVLQVPLIAESTLSNVEKYPYLFQPGHLFDPAEASMVAYMKQKGIKRIAILAGDNTTGKLASQVLADAARAAGVAVTSSVLVPVTAADATPQLLKAKATNPQAIAMTGFTPANGPIIKARAKLGWKVPVYGDKYMGAANLALIASPGDMKGITVQADPWSVKGNPATRSQSFDKFYAGVRQYQPHPPLNIIANLVSYNAAMLARYAAVKSHSFDAAKMAQALAGTPTSSSVPGFIGPQDLYTPTRHALLPKNDEFAYANAGPTVDGLIVPGA
jgi:branched-chain amino acid transport system substrate-binding protein